MFLVKFTLLNFFVDLSFDSVGTIASLIFVSVSPEVAGKLSTQRLTRNIRSVGDARKQSDILGIVFCDREM